jgi:radical SAM protein with 4Fe4S-binding SPASM domain
MNKDFFSKLIQENYAHLSYLIFYFQGEPYINPDFLEMVDFASRHKIYTLSSTNGHFLDEEIAKKTIESGLNRLIISIDGVTQTSYESYRKEGSLQQVLDNTKRLVELKRRMRSRTPHIVFQFLVVKPNQYEVPEMKKLADSIGVDELKFKTAQIYDYQHGNPLIPTIEKYSRYRKLDDKTYVLKNKLYNKCWKMWHSCVITWDGKVVPCCFDKDARYVMGDLNKNSLASIWNSQTYKRFRQDILNDRKQIDICTNCTEGNAVWTSD